MGAGFTADNGAGVVYKMPEISQQTKKTIKHLLF